MYDSIYMTVIQGREKLVDGDLRIIKWESVLLTGREYKMGYRKFVYLDLDGYMSIYISKKIIKAVNLKYVYVTHLNVCILYLSQNI